MADAIGWRDFFVFTILTGIPGMLMLARFVPWGMREPAFQVAAPRHTPPLSRTGVVVRASIGAACAWVVSVGLAGTLGGLSSLRAGRGFLFAPAALATVRPQTAGEWTTAAGVVLVALVSGLATAAALGARAAAERARSPGE